MPPWTLPCLVEIGHGSLREAIGAPQGSCRIWVPAHTAWACGTLPERMQACEADAVVPACYGMCRVGEGADTAALESEVQRTAQSRGCEVVLRCVPTCHYFVTGRDEAAVDGCVDAIHQLATGGAEATAVMAFPLASPLTGASRRALLGNNAAHVAWVMAQTGALLSVDAPVGGAVLYVTVHHGDASQQEAVRALFDELVRSRDQE